MGSALVTGSTGYLGAKIAARVPGVMPWRGDLREADPFSGVNPAGITEIYHCAAITRFNVDAASARAVNVDGSKRVFDFARRCPHLERLVHLSTLYVSGLDAGDVHPTPLAEPCAFANEYERSKWQAETLLNEFYDDLPWQIMRIATIVADDDSGRIVQHNVLHNTLRLMRHGLLPLIPGDPTVPIYLVTGDDAVNSIVAATGLQRVFHVCPDLREAPSLGELMDIAWVSLANQRLRIQPPFCPLDIFRNLVRGAPAGVLAQALASVLPFAPQLYVAKNIASSLNPTSCTRGLFEATVKQL